MYYLCTEFENNIMGHKKKKAKKKLTFDYMKAIKKADREICLEQTPGFQSTTRVHKSKKTYNRKKVSKKFDNVDI